MRSENSRGANERRDSAVPALTVIWHPDLDRIGEVCALEDLSRAEPRSISRLTPFFALPGEGRGRPLEVPHLSRSIPAFTIARGDRGCLVLDPGPRDVATELHGVPLDTPTIVTPAELHRGLIVLVARRIVLCLHRTEVPIRRDAPSMGLVGGGDGMEHVRRSVRRLAASDVPVLVRGETGTGKELAARAVVDASLRADKPFIAVNMAAFPASTAAAELFGHERGAFTGATAPRRGYFEEAAGGTLFLDEIGLMPPELQPMILRALETGEVVPVGASRPRKANVRLVAATDADLEAAIAARSFSEPLFQRLAGFQVELPPLRERREDFGSLLLHFLKAELTGPGETECLTAHGSEPPWLSASQVAQLSMGTWPGNIRALRNAVRQMVIAGRGEPRAAIDVAVERLMDARVRSPTSDDGPVHGFVALPEPAAEPERAKASDIDPRAFLAALERNRWSPGATAAELNIPRSTVHLLMDRHPDIRKPNSIPAAELRREFRECGGNVGLMAERLRVSRRGLQIRLSQLLQDASQSSNPRSSSPGHPDDLDE